MGKSGCTIGQTSGQTLVGVLSATVGAAVLFVAMTQVFIQVSKVKQADDRDSTLRQMLQLTGLSLDNPRSCSPLFSGQLITYTLPAGAPGFWAFTPSSRIVPDPMPPAGAQTGTWTLQGTELAIKSCKQAEGPDRGKDCLDPQSTPAAVKSEILGSLSFRLSSEHPVSRRIENRTDSFAVSLLSQQPVQSQNGADKVFTYTLLGCGTASSSVTNSANNEELLCQRLCVDLDTGQFQNGCWNPATRKCDLSYQVCAALGVARISSTGKCDTTELMKRALLKSPPAGGPSPTACAGTSQQPGATGLPLLLQDASGNRNQLFCRGGTYNSDTIPSATDCRSCVVAANPAALPVSHDTSCKAICDSDPATAGLTPWLRFDPGGTLDTNPSSPNFYCSCGTPPEGVDFCRLGRKECP